MMLYKLTSFCVVVLVVVWAIWVHKKGLENEIKEFKEVSGKL